MDGKYTGYAKNKWLFHYHSLNRFLWDVPGYETYRLNGYVVMTGEQHITDSGDYYGGNTLHEGDIIFVKDAPEETVETLLRREFVPIDAENVEYHALDSLAGGKGGGRNRWIYPILWGTSRVAPTMSTASITSKSPWSLWTRPLFPAAPSILSWTT